LPSLEGIAGNLFIYETSRHRYVMTVYIFQRSKCLTLILNETSTNMQTSCLIP
jgi:hypothetical protein